MRRAPGLRGHRRGLVSPGRRAGGCSPLPVFLPDPLRGSEERKPFLSLSETPPSRLRYDHAKAPLSQAPLSVPGWYGLEKHV